MKQNLPGDSIRDLTSSPIVGGHQPTTISKGHVNSPSQKRSPAELPGGRWWFEIICFIFIPILGKMIQFDLRQRGWFNHQRSIFFWMTLLGSPWWIHGTERYIHMNAWFLYVFVMVNVGKYTIPMDSMRIAGFFWISKPPVGDPSDCYHGWLTYRNDALLRSQKPSVSINMALSNNYFWGGRSGGWG